MSRRFALRILLGAGVLQVFAPATRALADDVGQTSAPAAEFGAFGDTELTAIRSGFFGFFQLARTDETAPNGGAVYRPTGQRFRAWVRFVARTDGTTSLTGLELRVRRAFLDDPGQAPFARDIVKSFLQDIVMGRDPDVGMIAREIQLRDLKVDILSGDDPAPLAPSPSEPFLAVAGVTPATTTHWAGHVFRFANTADGELVITAGPEQ